MYFDKCRNIDELKREYRRLAMINHPDKGGDIRVMQAINVEYESRLRYLVDNPGVDAEEKYDASEEYDIGERYRDIIEKIIHLPNIEIEVCGKWIWVSGNTYKVKDELKSAGFWWASQKRKWYWRPPEQSYKRNGSKQMEWIRGTYGSIAVNRSATLQIGGD